MRIGRIGRGLGLALAVLTALSVFALPAAAAAAKGTASIDPDQRQVLAGEVGALFDITVSNPAAPSGLPVVGEESNPAYNMVVVAPPANAFTAVSGSGPSGTDWTSRMNSFGHIFFEGDTIEDGESATFSIVADVARTGCDLGRTWDVYVSDDGGQTSVLQDPASPGALRTQIRVLEVIDVQLTGPSGVVDNSATQEQSGITARTTVLNAGSDALNVSATLGKASGNAGAPTTSPADANPKTILSQGTATFDFDVTMGSPGNLVLGGDASAASCADALNGLSDTISVMTKAALSYAGGLAPTHVVPGEPYAFRTNISKTGQVAVTLELVNSKFQFPAGAPEYEAALLDNRNIPGGNQGVTFNFAEQIVPLSLADGSYDPEILVAGTDENGAPVDTTVVVTDTVTLDRLIPIVKPELTPPSTEVVGAKPATTNGAELRFGGTIEDPAGNPCGGCAIQSAFLRQYDAAGNLIHQEDVKSLVTNTAGMIGGSYSGESATYATGAVSVELHMVVADQAGNAGPGTSDLVDVDLLKPELKEAFSGGPNGDDPRRVDVVLTELVRAPVGCQSLDWTVDNNVVTASQCQPLPNGHDHVILTLQDALDADAEPTLTYVPRLGANNRRLDRVALPLDDDSIPIRDGLLPELPVLEQVSGLTKYDGQFWTNESSPDFLVTNVADGHLVKVWNDVNGNGQIDEGTDQEIASGNGDPEGEANLQSSGTIGTNGDDINLLVQALDSRFNSSPLADELLTIDQTAPQFDSVAFVANDVVVTFNEPLREGRDAFADWTVVQGSGFSELRMKPASVSGDRETRTLSIDHADYDSTQVNAVGYEFMGAQGDRYFDRAGNLLADFNASVSGA